MSLMQKAMLTCLLGSLLVLPKAALRGQRGRLVAGRESRFAHAE